MSKLHSHLSFGYFQNINVIVIHNASDNRGKCLQFALGGIELFISEDEQSDFKSERQVFCYFH